MVSIMAHTTNHILCCDEIVVVEVEVGVEIKVGIEIKVEGRRGRSESENKSK
jgi:hypothetical protein